MNKMNNDDIDMKRYKISNEVISENVDSGNSDTSNNQINNGYGGWRMVSYYGILAIICIMSFLVAKYIVRSRIDGEKSPIDTSERL